MMPGRGDDARRPRPGPPPLANVYGVDLIHTGTWASPPAPGPPRWSHSACSTRPSSGWPAGRPAARPRPSRSWASPRW